MTRGTGFLVCFVCWALLAVTGPTFAQEPSPETEALLRALEPAVTELVDNANKGNTVNNAVSTGAVLTALGGILGFAWRVAPRIGRDPDVVAGMARLEEKLGALKESTDKGFADVKRELDQVAERVNSLEGAPPKNRQGR